MGKGKGQEDKGKGKGKEDKDNGKGKGQRGKHKSWDFDQCIGHAVSAGIQQGAFSCYVSII